MIDPTDKRLIELLGKDASQTSRALSKELEVDSSTIRRRVKKLVKEHVIQITAIPVFLASKKVPTFGVAVKG